MTQFAKHTHLLAGIITLFFTSCIKNQPECTGNCYSLVVAGSVYDNTNGKALANVPVEVYWAQKGGTPPFTTYYNIAKSRSGSNGAFSIQATIDTTFFSNYTLNIKVQPDSSWFLDSTGAAPYSYAVSESRLNETDLTNLAVACYPKTNLTLNIQHTMQDAFLYFSVESAFAQHLSFVDYIISSGQEVADTTFTVPAAADVSTRITWTKTTDLGQSIVKVDSIRCVRNSNNFFRLQY